MAAPVPKAPFILLGLMTLATFGGPLAIFLTLRGGRNPDWPPDRAVEWWTFGLITGSVAVLMVACLSVGALYRKKASRGVQEIKNRIPSPGIQEPSVPLGDGP